MLYLNVIRYRNNSHSAVSTQPPGPEYVNGDVVNPRATTQPIAYAGGGNITSSQNYNMDANIRNQQHGTNTHRDPFDMSKLHLHVVGCKFRCHILPIICKM